MSESAFPHVDLCFAVLLAQTVIGHQTGNFMRVLLVTQNTEGVCLKKNVTESGFMVAWCVESKNKETGIVYRNFKGLKNLLYKPWEDF